MAIKSYFMIFLKFIFEKLDIPVEIPPEKEVLWICSFGQEWNIFILPFLDTLKVWSPAWAIFFVFWPFRGTVYFRALFFGRQYTDHEFWLACEIEEC